MSAACWLALLIGFVVGIGGTVVLWAACIVSGAHADAEIPEE